MYVVRRRQARADVEELPQADVGGQEPDCPAKERPILARGDASVGRLEQHLCGRFPIGGTRAAPSRPHRQETRDHEDFTSRFIPTGTSISDGITLLASTDWEAAVTALRAGELPASGGERRILLLAASIAGGIPVSLSDTLPGIDRRNASLVVSAVARATGHADPETGKP